MPDGDGSCRRWKSFTGGRLVAKGLTATITVTGGHVQIDNRGCAASPPEQNHLRQGNGLRVGDGEQ